MRDAYTELSNASGSAAAEQEKYINSLSGKLNALSENIKGIWIDAVDTGFVGDVVDSLNAVVSAFREFTNYVGSIPAILSTVTLGFTAFSKQGRELAQSMTNIIPGANNLSNKLNLLGNSLKDQEKNLEANIQAAQGYITKMQGTGVSVSAAQAKLKTYNSQLGKTKIAMNALKVAATLMNAAISAGLSLLVSWGIEKITQVIDNIIITKEELKELNEEFNSKYADTGNTISLVDNYKMLAEALRNTSRESEEYGEISNQLESVERKLLEVYPQLNTAIEKNGDLKWKNVEAIEALTNAELENAKAQARVTLGNNKVDNYDDIREAVDQYNELIKKQREYSRAFDRGEKSVQVGITTSFSGDDRIISKNTTKALSEVNDKVNEARTKLETYYNALQILGKDGYAQFGNSIEFIKEALGMTDEEITKITDSVGTMGTEFGNAALGVDKLATSFSSFAQPIEMLRTMIEEFQEFGGLTDETYMKVLDSGNSGLIALLADSENFLTNAKTLLSS